MNYFVTGIDTDSGKTLVSAILCKALNYNYWKPIQSGLPKDSDAVKALAPQTFIYPERHLLKTPASPHASAKLDGVNINIHDFQLPANDTLIIEGAGGCLVPINDTHFVIDIARHLKTPIILVADLYLGSINHTLLTSAYLKSNNLTVKGLIFNGDENIESERIILQHTSYLCLLKIRRESVITTGIVNKYASLLMENWNE
jgi:dethiobiotin synthetase